MVFKIVVCIKQVPDTSDIKWTAQNTIQRDGLDSVINPFDIAAIQMANNIKFVLQRVNCDVEINVVTMGPKQAITAIRTALAMGCDRGFLLSDKNFSGADTLATAYTLSQFVKTHIPDFSLIICGQQAIDGDTAQTPSSMAEKLGIAQATNIVALKEVNPAYSILIKETNELKQEIKSGYPLLIATILNNVEIIPKINDYIRAQSNNIELIDAVAIKADFDKIGLKGSPTQVKKAYKPVIERNTVLLESKDINDYAGLIIEKIMQCRNNND